MFLPKFRVLIQQRQPSNRDLKQAAVIHKIPIQVGSVISKALLQLNSHFANDRSLLMTVSCCLRFLILDGRGSRYALDSHGASRHARCPAEPLWRGVVILEDIQVSE